MDPCMHAANPTTSISQSQAPAMGAFWQPKEWRYVGAHLLQRIKVQRGSQSGLLRNWKQRSYVAWLLLDKTLWGKETGAREARQESKAGGFCSTWGMAAWSTYVLLLAKGKANVVRSGSCFGEQERRHRFGEQDKDKSLSGSNHPGAFLRQSITYVNHYGQVHRVIFMLVALQR